MYTVGPVLDIYVALQGENTPGSPKPLIGAQVTAGYGLGTRETAAIGNVGVSAGERERRCQV